MKQILVFFAADRIEDDTLALQHTPARGGLPGDGSITVCSIEKIVQIGDGPTERQVGPFKDAE